MRALALALVVAAAVAGCGGSSGETPRALPSVSSSPSAVASPTPTGKDAPTPEGAAEFAKYVYAQIEQAFATNNPELIKAVSLPECTSCTHLYDSAKRTADAHGRVLGYRISVVAAVAPATTGDTARVDVIRNSTANVEYDGSGKVVSREPALKGIEDQMNLRWVGGAWRVSEIVRIRVRG
jgi:hypothetical protein